jgi:hypothetical protein
MTGADCELNSKMPVSEIKNAGLGGPRLSGEVSHVSSQMASNDDLQGASAAAGYVGCWWGYA